MLITKQPVVKILLPNVSVKEIGVKKDKHIIVDKGFREIRLPLRYPSPAVLDYLNIPATLFSIHSPMCETDISLDTFYPVPEVRTDRRYKDTIYVENANDITEITRTNLKNTIVLNKAKFHRFNIALISDKQYIRLSANGISTIRIDYSYNSPMFGQEPKFINYNQVTQEDVDSNSTYFLLYNSTELENYINEWTRNRDITYSLDKAKKSRTTLSFIDIGLIDKTYLTSLSLPWFKETISSSTTYHRILNCIKGSEYTGGFQKLDTTQKKNNIKQRLNTLYSNHASKIDSFFQNYKMKINAMTLSIGNHTLYSHSETNSQAEAPAMKVRPKFKDTQYDRDVTFWSSYYNTFSKFIINNLDLGLQFSSTKVENTYVKNVITLLLIGMYIKKATNNSSLRNYGYYDIISSEERTDFETVYLRVSEDLHQAMKKSPIDYDIELFRIDTTVKPVKNLKEDSVDNTAITLDEKLFDNILQSLIKGYTEKVEKVD